MTFWAVFLWILQYLFQIPQNPTIFYTFFHKIAPFLHVYYTKFDKKFSFFENFGFSQKFPVGIGFFQSIKVVNIIFECWKVENVQSNKVDITSYSWTVCLEGYWSMSHFNWGEFKSSSSKWTRLSLLIVVKVEPFPGNCKLNVNNLFVTSKNEFSNSRI